jgi:hypothetical protein
LINNRQNGRRRGRGGQRPQGNPGAPGGGNRIDNRARGNAQQLHEKYKNLAQDAQRAGDRVTTEYYLQFADHYFRVLSESRARFEEQRRPADDEFDGEEGDEFEQRDPRDARDQREPREQRELREPRGERGNGRDRNGYRRDDERRERQPEPAYAEGGDTDDRGEDEGDRRPRRARRLREEGDQPQASNEGFDANILPPAIAPVGDGEEAPAPRRRSRRSRTETANDTVEVPPAA